MKRFIDTLSLVTLIALITTTPAYALGNDLDEMVFEETFDVASIQDLLDAGWVLNNDGTGETSWVISSDAQADDHPFDETAPFLIVDSESATEGEGLIERLTTPSFSFESVDVVLLHYATAYRAGEQSDGRIEYSIDQNSFGEAEFFYRDTTVTDGVLDLSHEVAGQSNVRFRFSYVDDPGTGRYWAIDNVWIETAMLPRFYGQVMLEETAGPAEGVLMVVVDEESGEGVAEAVTDVSGNYSVTVQPGTYSLEARLPGYDILEEGPFEVGYDETNEVNFEFPEHYHFPVVGGTIYSADTPDTPVPGVAITVEGSVAVVSNEDGQFVIEGLDEGTYTLYLTHNPVGSMGYHDMETTLEVVEGNNLVDFYLPEILPPQNVVVHPEDGMAIAFWDPPANHTDPEGLFSRIQQLSQELERSDVGEDLSSRRKLEAMRNKLEQLCWQRDHGGEVGVDRLEDFVGYRVKLDDERLSELFADPVGWLADLENGHAYEVRVAAEYGYSAPYLVWSDPVVVRPIPTILTWYEELDFDWVEIRPGMGGHGTLLLGAGDDSTTGLLPMDGFDFRHFGAHYQSLAVCSNGYLSFIDSTETVHLTMPNPSAPNALIVPLNVDTDCGTPEDESAIYGWYDQSNNRYVILYAVEFWNVPGDTYLYEVILNGDDNTIDFLYHTASNGWDTHPIDVIGIEDDEGVNSFLLPEVVAQDEFALRIHNTYVEYGTIEGVVYDISTQSPIEEAIVEVTGRSGTVWTATSDARGEYEVLLVDQHEGPFSVEVRMRGYFNRIYEGLMFEPEDGGILPFDAELFPLRTYVVDGNLMLAADPPRPAYHGLLCLDDTDEWSSLGMGSGAFLFTSDPGEHTIRFAHEGYDTLAVDYEIEWDTESIHLPDLMLQPSYDLQLDPVLPTPTTFLSNIELATFNGDPLEFGDEIGAFDGDLCVGAAMVDGEWPLSFTSWGEYSDSSWSGFQEGSLISYKIFRSGSDLILPAEISFAGLDTLFFTGGNTSITLLSANWYSVEGSFMVQDDPPRPAFSGQLLVDGAEIVDGRYPDGSFRALLGAGSDHVIVLRHPGYTSITHSIEITEDTYVYDLGMNVLQPLDSLHLAPVLPTGSSHLVTIGQALMNNHPLQDDDEIGVFDGDLCVGAARAGRGYPLEISCYGATPDSGWAGYLSGNEISFKMYLRSQDVLLPAIINDVEGATDFGDGDSTAVGLLRVVWDEVASDVEALPTVFALYPPFPNPFNGQVSLRYDLPQPAEVQLIVHSILGREVADVRLGSMKAGFQRASLNLSTHPSGMYMVTIHAGEWKATKRLLLIK